MAVGTCLYIIADVMSVFSSNQAIFTFWKAWEMIG